MDSRNEDFIHAIRIDPGEKIVESIMKYLEGREDEIPSGFFTGIGATSSAEIGWYDLDNEKYVTTVIDENCEVVSLIGNIVWIEGKPMIHVHVTLGKSDYSLVGGHLVEGTVSVTCEIWIHKTPIRVTRKPAKLAGLKLIEFE